MSLLLQRRFAKEFVQNHGRRVQQVNFRLTCMAQKRRCLNSLLIREQKEKSPLEHRGESALFCQQILSTDSLRNFMEVSLEKCYVDIVP